MEELKKLKLNELGRVSEKEYKDISKRKVIVVLDNIRSAHNVGSVFRTSDGFLFEEIVLVGICPTPPNKEITKTALGSEKTVPFKYLESAEEYIKELKGDGYKVYGIEQTNQSFSIKDVKEGKLDKVVYILGNEVKGVSIDLLRLCDDCIEIPMEGTKHSFNVSVCNGIVAWEFANKVDIK